MQLPMHKGKNKHHHFQTRSPGVFPVRTTNAYFFFIHSQQDAQIQLTDPNAACAEHMRNLLDGVRRDCIDQGAQEIHAPWWT